MLGIVGLVLVENQLRCSSLSIRIKAHLLRKYLCRVAFGF